MKNENFNTCFYDYIKKILPNEDSYEEFLKYHKKKLRLSIRVNTLKIKVPEFKVIANQNNWILEPIPWTENGFWITLPKEYNLGNSIEHILGLIYIQEASSMLPPVALSFQNKKNGVVLDMAAAPGSKTTQIGEIYDESSLIIANELSSSRIKALTTNVRRCGLKNVIISHHDAIKFGKFSPETFDSILLDAPCTGEGVSRKDNNALSNWNLSTIMEYMEIQKKLIQSAFDALKPGGSLVYSTCTLNLYENQKVCQYLKETYNEEVESIPLDKLFDGAHKSTTKEGFLHVFPHTYDSEGFFIAKFTKKNIFKKNNTTSNLISPNRPNFPYTKLSQIDIAKVHNELEKNFGYCGSLMKNIWKNNDQLWLFPECENENIFKIMRFNRFGTSLAKTIKNSFKWEHESLVNSFSFDSIRPENRYVLNKDEVIQWFEGKNINIKSTESIYPFLVLFYQDICVGYGKIFKKNQIKNNIPRYLVKDPGLIY